MMATKKKSKVEKIAPLVDPSPAGVDLIDPAQHTVFATGAFRDTDKDKFDSKGI
jgi:hypothetical protein